MNAKDITLNDYNKIMFRRLVVGLHEDHGLRMSTRRRPRGHYKATSTNNTRTLLFQFSGLRPKAIQAIRKDSANLTRHVKVGEKRNVRFSEPGGGVLCIEIAKLGKHWQVVTVPTLESRRCIKPGSLKMGLGLGHQDKPLSIDFAQVHNGTVGIFGISQSGKTFTTKLLIWSALMSDADVILADVGYGEKNLGVFAGAKSLAHPLITTPADGYSLLTWLKAEILRRANTGDNKMLFVCIDEVQTFIDLTSAYGDSAKLLSDITRQCIQVGIRLIVTTQQAEIGLIGKTLNNLRVRLCHRVDKASSSTFALGVKNAGAESLLGYGDCLYKNDDGLHRMSVARLDEDKDAKQYARIERGEPRHIPTLGKTLLESVGQDISVSASPSNAPDELNMGQVASVIFDPAGIGKIANRLGVGKAKAKRIQAAAQEVRSYAFHNGHKSLPEPDKSVIEAVESGGYDWLKNEWAEI